MLVRALVDKTGHWRETRAIRSSRSRLYIYDSRTGRVCLVSRWLWEVVELSVAGLHVRLQTEVDQVSWNREKRCVCAIAGVDQVVCILTPYEARSRSPVMNLRYNIR